MLVLVVRWKNQHAEGAPTVFGFEFVMHIVGFSYTLEVFNIGCTQPLESLVNKNLMNHEVQKSINKNPKSNEDPPVIEIVHHSKHDKQPTGNSENEEKQIVPFKPARGTLVVIFVKNPQGTVHHVFVDKPRCKFHETHGGQKQTYFQHHFHRYPKNS